MRSDLSDMLSAYLKATEYGAGDVEMEVRFGTRGRTKIFKQDYDEVVKRLLSAGFVKENEQDLLRINNQYTDVRKGITKMSNVRTELTGLATIQQYCRTNSLSDVAEGSGGIGFTQKMGFGGNSGTGVVIKPVDFDDFNFRIALQTEKSLTRTSGMIRELLDEWGNKKKTFRYLNRVTLKHPDHPFKVDMSIVKTSSMGKSGYGNRLQAVPVYNIAESNVFQNAEEYEIEIEVDNAEVHQNPTLYGTPETLYGAMRKGIHLILAGLQRTNYPVSYNERDEVILQYMKMVNGSGWGEGG